MTVRIDDLLPVCEIIFKQRAVEAIKVQPKGIVCYVLVDSNAETEFTKQEFEYGGTISGVTDALKKDIEDIFDGGAKKVILATCKTDINTNIEEIKVLDFDTIFTTSTASGDKTTIKTIANLLKRIAVIYNLAADSKYCVNFVTPSAVDLEGNTISAEALLPVIVGVIAGCSYKRSILYKNFSTIYKSVTLPATPAEGTLFYHYDNDLEQIKVCKPVNSLLTLGEDDTPSMQKIKIVQGMMRVETDIRLAWKRTYQGKFNNIYDNQVLFYNSAKFGYFRELEKLGVLDPNYDNSLFTDVEEQRAVWVASGRKTQEEIENFIEGLK